MLITVNKNVYNVTFINVISKVFMSIVVVSIEKGSYGKSVAVIIIFLVYVFK